MGNLQSTQRPIMCEICNKQIQLSDLLTCVRCNISLHTSCYDIVNGNKNYTQCPKCERVGCIGKYMIDD